MIYFDNGSTSFPKAPGVGAAMAALLENAGFNINRGGYEGAYAVADMVLDTREMLCKLFDWQDPKDVCFTGNVTQSLNLILKGFLKPGDHVVVSSMEHNAVMRPLNQLAAQGVAFDAAQADPDGTLPIARVEALLRPDTRLVVMTHASNICGTILPIQAVGALCKEKGIPFVVDAAQTAGILPLSMKDLHAAAIAFTGHKGLMGPQGTGGLCIRPGVEIRPWKTGGTGVQSYLRTQPSEYPTRLEAGTLNSHGIMGLSAALDFIAGTGVENIAAHERALMERFYQGVAELRGVRVYGDFTQRPRAAIVALNIGELDSGEVSDCLSREYGIATRPGAHCAPRMHQALHTTQQGAVRFSFSWYNTAGETDAAIRAVSELAQSV